LARRQGLGRGKAGSPGTSAHPFQKIPWGLRETRGYRFPSLARSWGPTLGRLQAHDLVEASEADVERRVCHQLDDLGLREVAAQLRPEPVVDLVVVNGELLGEPDGGPLARAQEVGALVIDRRDLGLRRPRMPA